MTQIYRRNLTILQSPWDKLKVTGKNEGERNKCGSMVTNSFLLHVLPLVVEGDYSGPAFQFQSGVPVVIRARGPCSCTLTTHGLTQ